MRKPIIAGNWKMNKTLSEAVAFVEEVKNNIPSTDKVDAAIGAPAVFLAPMVEAAKGFELEAQCTKHVRQRQRGIHRRNQPGHGR